ncbi:MAG: hypothetical protein HQL27_03860 [Candidatus Omnitrophica bacterium]|nr:hypothetical protein [Candidatus Omnitrophota bacterium]
MTLAEIKNSFGGLDVFEQRADTEDYKEIVFFAKDLDKWNNVLSKFFGSAVKPPKAKPEKDHIELARNFGGVRENQVLFKKDLPGQKLIALLWPWSDGERITLKLAKIEA